MNRQIIVLEFNELCPGLMDRFIASGHLPGFKALRDSSTTYVTDAGEDPPNLEPWIQWVTVHTGMSFPEHKVFELGDAHKLDAPRIWDYVVEDGRSVWVCGSMNATIKKPSAKTWFIPDPWSSEVKPQPPGEFDLFTGLAWKYVQEHSRASGPWGKKDYIAFLFYMIRHGLSVKTVAMAGYQIMRDMREKALRWKRAIILDRLQWDLFRNTWKKKKPDFSTLFINSTAHFQHYHWRDMEPQSFPNRAGMVGTFTSDAILDGYKAMDGIVRECMSMAPKATIVLMTALSQQPLLAYEAIGGKFIFKPIDPAKLFEFASVKGSYKYAPVMAEEFRIYFDSEAEAEQAETALRALTINGQPLMRAFRKGSEVFGGCDVISCPEPGEQVRSSLHNRTDSFGDLFYQADGAKSGCHHRDGIFWIRTPGMKALHHADKLPLVDAAYKLAAISGVSFPERAEPVEDEKLAIAS